MPTLLDLAYAGNYAGSNGCLAIFTYHTRVYYVARVTGIVFTMEGAV